LGGIKAGEKGLWNVKVRGTLTLYIPKPFFATDDKVYNGNYTLWEGAVFEPLRQKMHTCRENESTTTIISKKKTVRRDKF
jgi:hypothetical protein